MTKEFFFKAQKSILNPGDGLPYTATRIVDHNFPGNEIYRFGKTMDLLAFTNGSILCLDDHFNVRQNERVEIVSKNAQLWISRSTVQCVHFALEYADIYLVEAVWNGIDRHGKHWYVNNEWNVYQVGEGHKIIYDLLNRYARWDEEFTFTLFVDEEKDYFLHNNFHMIPVAKEDK